ncbi:hypothetical protein As57867_017647, partial [Aphanomyces stellatus]
IDRLNAAVWTKENSLHLTDGPIYAVTLFELPNGDQYLHITIHHTLVDFVSYRILFDDLQLLLSGAKLGSKTMSFKEWSERQSAQALLWDPALWTEYMTTDALPPAEKCSYSKIKARGSLNATLTEKLDQANVVYGTNVQELALGALTCALGQLRQNVEGYQLPLMLEGHGREPWDLSTDVSNTIGWFTTLYPIVFTATSNIGDLLRQVKQKIRAVPHNGLSYGAIKYLTPATDATVAIKAHRQHNLSFNYAGRFQEMNAQSGLFETVQAVADVIGPEEVNDFIENIYLHHEGSSLVLDLSVAEWLFSKQDLERWIDLWVVWMEKIVDHCLDPNTIGGRTLSDVPLLRSASVVANVEAELLSTLDMRPLDVEDIYPVTPLQAGMLSAMIQDSSEYVLHATMDIRGDLEFSQLQSCWVQLAEQESLLRTVFVSTPEGIFQAVVVTDRSEWTLLNDIWPNEEVESRTKLFFQEDRRRGFSFSDTSFHRFTGIRISDGGLRVIWTTHHAVMDGWSETLLVDRLRCLCNGTSPPRSRASFQRYISWLSDQPVDLCETFWTSSLENIDQAIPLSLPAPLVFPTGKQRYQVSKHIIQLPQLASVCKNLHTTPSSIFHAAWALVLHQYTRSNMVLFGSVVSGRDINLEGVESIVGVLINTVPILASVLPTASVRELILSVHGNIVELPQYSHASLVDIKRWTSQHTWLFDSILGFGNYSSCEDDLQSSSNFSIEFQEAEEFMDSNIGISIYPFEDKYRIEISHKAQEIDSTIMSYLGERYLKIISKLGNIEYTDVAIESLDEPYESEQYLRTASSKGIDLSLPFELLHHAYESQVDKNPNIRAIEYEDEWLSYGELNAQANNLAFELANMGVCVGSRVAVVIERCLEFPIGLLAALKVGAAIMTLDATFPPKRLEHMLLDANAHVVLTMDKYRATIETMDMNIQVLYFKANALGDGKDVLFKPHAHNIATRDDEAFIVYTSGSTGKPKGVPVLHRGAVNVMMNMTMPGIRPGARAMQFMAIGFDGCQWEMWCTLSFGATLVLRSSNVFDTISKVEILIDDSNRVGAAWQSRPVSEPEIYSSCW